MNLTGLTTQRARSRIQAPTQFYRCHRNSILQNSLGCQDEECDSRDEEMVDEIAAVASRVRSPQ